MAEVCSRRRCHADGGGVEERVVRVIRARGGGGRAELSAAVQAAGSAAVMRRRTPALWRSDRPEAATEVATAAEVEQAAEAGAVEAAKAEQQQQQHGVHKRTASVQDDGSGFTRARGMAMHGQI